MTIRRFPMILAGLAVTTFTAGTLLSAPAEAAPKKRYVSARPAANDRTVVRWQDENGRVRTRIIVQKRSYLDAGTNVVRGERKFTDYVISPTYSAVPEAMRRTAADRASETMPGPFDLPGKNNPRQW